ncbi:hypothetical protein K7711_40940 [Nocardia sp. CA2R105]|nr:hypothetical protein [Nocardia coffeae]
MAHRAQESVQLPDGASFRTIRVGIDCLRPAPPDGSLTLRSSLVRRGRRLWIMRTAIRDQSDRTVAAACGIRAVMDVIAIASLESRG